MEQLQISDAQTNHDKIIRQKRIFSKTEIKKIINQRENNQRINRYKHNVFFKKDVAKHHDDYENWYNENAI